MILVVAACVLVYAGMFINFGLYFSFISEGGIPVELGGVAIGMASTFWIFAGSFELYNRR